MCTEFNQTIIVYVVPFSGHLYFIPVLPRPFSVFFPYFVNPLTVQNFSFSWKPRCVQSFLFRGSRSWIFCCVVPVSCVFLTISENQTPFFFYVIEMCKDSIGQSHWSSSIWCNVHRRKQLVCWFVLLFPAQNFLILSLRFLFLSTYQVLIAFSLS